MNQTAFDESGDILDTQESSENQYVTFQLQREAFGFPMVKVLEIIRVPKTVAVPLTPTALVGLANLRGSVLPILDLRQVLHFEQSPYNESTRVVIADAGRPVGLIVDRVNRVVQVEPDTIEAIGQHQSSINVEFLTGVIKSGDKAPLVQLLDIAKIIAKDFAYMTQRGEPLDASSLHQGQHHRSVNTNDDDTKQLVSFFVEQQEYAFHLMDIAEIVRVPESFSKLPQAAPHVLGIMDLRSRLLPLVCLRRMFALSTSPLQEHNRVLVVNLQRPAGGSESIGIVVDQIREVLTVSHDAEESIPELLQQSFSSKDITGVCRLEQGKRLVSVLSAAALFNHPDIRAAMESAGPGQQNDEGARMPTLSATHIHDDDADTTAQLVVFSLDEQEYGVSIEDVQEITRLPERMDRVPKTPKFIEGMMNLRGTVLPVMDMRLRFNLEKMSRNDMQRIVVLSINGTRTGFIVDQVAEVLRLPKEQIEEAPNLSDDQRRMMGKVVNLKQRGRMIQVLEAQEMLSEQQLQAVNSQVRQLA